MIPNYRQPVKNFPASFSISYGLNYLKSPSKASRTLFSPCPGTPVLLQRIDHICSIGYSIFLFELLFRV